MKTRRSWMQRIAIMGCGLVALTLLVSNADAGKRQSLLWSNGAKVGAVYYPGGVTSWPQIRVSWPAADGADHYQITVLEKVGKNLVLYFDHGPLANYVQSYSFGAFEGHTTYVIIVTAYDSPDEATAYSESIQTSFTVR